MRTAPRRVPGRPWPKGVSGNPEGRRVERPELREIRDLAASYAPEAVRTLAALMTTGHPEAVRLAAVRALLAYGLDGELARVVALADEAAANGGPSGHPLV
jgi:hypothetical protein